MKTRKGFARGSPALRRGLLLLLASAAATAAAGTATAAAGTTRNNTAAKAGGAAAGAAAAAAAGRTEAPAAVSSPGEAEARYSGAVRGDDVWTPPPTAMDPGSVGKGPCEAAIERLLSPVSERTAGGRAGAGGGLEMRRNMIRQRRCCCSSGSRVCKADRFSCGFCMRCVGLKSLRRCFISI